MKPSDSYPTPVDFANIQNENPSQKPEVQDTLLESNMKLFLKSLIMNKIQIKFQPMLHLNFKSTKNLVMKRTKIKILLHLHLKLIMK